MLGAVGYLLSPLSWWNDLYVNLPLAYLAANAAALAAPRLFLPVLTGAYWFTNVAGLVLMHAGARGAAGGQGLRMSRRDLWKWGLLSVAYSLAVVLLVKSGALKPLHEYAAHAGNWFRSATEGGGS